MSTSCECGLDKNDTAFLLWCMGYIQSAASENSVHYLTRKYITEGSDVILPKIARLHEELAAAEPGQ